MPADIPGGLQDPHFYAIKGFLHTILNELRAKETGARRVVTRLNRSNQAQPSPIFVGVVEDDAITDLRRQQGHAPPHGDVGKDRFNKRDPNPSVVYSETVNDATGAIKQRTWNGQSSEKTPGAKQMGKSANCTFQRFIAIRIPVGNQHRHVGTLTVGFDQDPTGQKMADVERTMKDWAQRDQSEFVKYLKDTFNLNGPTHP
jgi:hypothetical protein